MKKYTVRIYNYYNNVVKEYHLNHYTHAKACAKRFCRWWSDIIESDSLATLFVYDTNGFEREYNEQIERA